MQRKIRHRHIVPGEEDIIAPAAKIGQRQITKRRLKVINWIGSAEFHDESILKQAQAKIALLAHVKEVFAITTCLQKDIPPNRMGGADKRVRYVVPVTRFLLLLQAPIQPRI